MDSQRCCLAFLLLVVAATTTQGQLRFDPNRSVKKEDPPHPQIFYDGVNPPKCPEPRGIHEDEEFCDSYWKCDNNVAKEHYCPDGLVFDIKKGLGHHADPCDTPHVVHCGTRQALQEATFPNELCPRRYGTFEHPDTTICNVYYQCVDAVSTEVKCATGLHFNRTQGSCNWPHIAMRDGCVDKPKVSADGVFSCPPGPHFSADGQKNPHPAYPNEEDCSKFYVCLNGETPQAASCDGGLVFDTRTMLCGLPETVPECLGWYANDPNFAHYYEDTPATGRNDPGRQDTAGG